MRLARCAVIGCILQALACGGETPPAKTVSLRVRGEGTPNATVVIDDQRIGPLASVRKRGVALPPGKHTVTVEMPGYFPYDTVVEAPDNALAPPIFIDVELAKVPD
ncbi:MAG TPA: PEGA domain-containing protein [Polyangiaceae bacterium]